ncbi:MAG TPA: hypothetical protein VN901_17250 [Candidatus Acidoferrales bacterium]|nr:hypothetical protein [Candidatus Acidoferrales bacterium]
MAKLIAASGPVSDPEREQQRQMFLTHLQEVELLRQGEHLRGDEDAFGATG